MNPVKTLWSLLFRLFPCPVPLGLHQVGSPGPDSPVLVTCNFHLTLQRLLRVLRRDGVDAWLLVAESRGVNVWCAAGGDEFNTHSVVSSVKTSGIANKVKHRRLILPPLAAPGVRAADVHDQTGWKVSWGPVRARDIAQYLSEGKKRDEPMMRATYDWKERLDTGLGSLFPFYLVGALGFAVLAPTLLPAYLWVAAACFVLFMLACPWIPGEHGLTKVLILDAALGLALLAGEILWPSGTFPARVHLVIAMVSLLVYGSELGGLASTMPSDLDPFMAKLGIGAVGNVAWAGTVRTELLNGYRELQLEHERCIGCRQCYQVCPLGVWEMGQDRRAVQARPQLCTACRACLVQCRSGAIQARPTRLGLEHGLG